MKKLPGRVIRKTEEEQEPPKKVEIVRELVLTDRQIKYQKYWGENKDRINERRRARYQAHPRFKHPDRAAQKAAYWREFWVKNKDRIAAQRKEAAMRNRKI